MTTSVQAALKSANDLCRSAYQIAERSGESTNWDAFRDQLKKSLEIQHKAMYPAAKGDASDG